MIRIKKTINHQQSILCIVTKHTSQQQIKAAVSTDAANMYKLCIKEDRLKSGKLTAIQLNPLPNSVIIGFLRIDDDKKNKLTAFRNACAAAIRDTKQSTNLQWVNCTDLDDWDTHLSQVIEMVNYKPPSYKKISTNSKSTKNCDHILVNGTKKNCDIGQITGTAVNKARTFANEPANILTTTTFVDQIKMLFKDDPRFKVTVLDEKKCASKKMNALLGVGQGSEYPSYLVDIEYNGGGSDHIAIIGKGVMFDTGGISIKPSRNMKEMKGDMGGAAAVVASAWATGQLNIKRRVSFIVPIVENMVSKTAQRPGHVVVASNGVSIEITNTDAEGRLIMADALVYASKKKVSAIIDIATLTGASIIALGPYAISICGNNQPLIDSFLLESQKFNEQCWQLPLFDEYKELIKSDIADCLNANEGREAGVITAAKFLEYFVDDIPWMHCDIASTMSVSSNRHDQVKGMTGSGTRSLISFIMNGSL